MPHERALPKLFLRHCLLLLLEEDGGHGYDLVERLRAFGFTGSDPGGVYRALRTMEHDGVVRSVWEHSAVGPHRRCYEVTETGRSELRQDAGKLAQASEILADFLARYRKLGEAGSGETMSAR